MSRLEILADRFLAVGKHPFRLCMRSTQEQSMDKEEHYTESAYYSKLWPIIFLFSAITDFPMPLPKDKRPGSHRDWGWMPILIVVGLVAFVCYGYVDCIVCKCVCTSHNDS